MRKGYKAPDFELKNTKGKPVKLSDFLGKRIVLYFYPKDGTPGCTKQACSIRDNFSAIKKKAIVFGISMDSMESHKKFTEKYSLPFDLLCDTKGEVSKAYGVKRFI